MYTLIIFFICFSLIYGQCNHTSPWFNENHPWDSHLNGSDIERFSLIRAKYPSVFEMTRWTGSFEIRQASHQMITDKTKLIVNYTQINDGFICHGINGKQCIDFEIRFCLEHNLCSESAYPPIENYTAGGREVRPYSFPWHVSIQYSERHICGGTLIDNRHVLTAAHCFQESFIPIPYSVVLGAHFLSNSTHRISISRLKIHSDFNDATSENDIGLIRLNEPIKQYSNRIRPACLPRSMRQPSESNPLIIVGWNKLQNNTWSVVPTDELRQTILTEMDTCSNVHRNYDVKKQICAGSARSRRNLCQGDIGSGLFEKVKYDIDRWIPIGIVSYGCEYAPQGYPGVYIRISAYHDWIQNTIEQMNKEN